MHIQINKTNEENKQRFALFNLGFRPFFLGASIFAIISMASWMLVYFLNGLVTISHISASQWHAHEMLYGYGMAVVTGFLLTAVKNWTGIPTLSGTPLAIFFTLWCVARVLFLFGTSFLPWAATADLLFGLMLIVAIAMPIIKAKKWMQLVVVIKVILLVIGNIVFFLGYFDVLTSGILYAINGAVLLFISLILMIGRRIIPFFIERGVEGKVQLKQYKWLDISILVIFLALSLNVIFIQATYLTSLFTWALFALNGLRLCNWYTAGIWRVPLLWSLYLSAWFINLGFMLYGLQSENSNMSILTLHMFTIGGIGLITLSMMSRVALGHTGRDIRNPSPWVCVAFASLIISVMFRVLVPLITSQFYTTWVLLAAICWILSFAIYTIIYLPILIKPRYDGTFG